nr:ataxin-7-like protein 1 isoform X2 [Paramormyrops kingsleyae]
MHNRNQRRYDSPSEPGAPSRALQGPDRNRGAPSQKTGATPHKAARAPREHPHSAFGRATHAVYPPKASRGKPCMSVPVVSLEKMPGLGRAEGGHVRLSCTPPSSSSSSSSSLYSPPPQPASQRSQERLVNGKGPAPPPVQFEQRNEAPPSPYDWWPSSSPSVMDRQARPHAPPSPYDWWPSSSPSVMDRQTRPHAPPSPMHKRASASLSVLDRKTQNGTEGSKTYKRLSGRVFDPDKHCGVLDPESNRPCTRSLTCKTHSLTHRRAVPGRRKLFDTLLAEHKGRAKEKDRGCKREPPAGRGRLSPEPGPADHPNGNDTRSPLKTRLASLCVPRLPAGGAVGMFSCPGPPLAPAPPCLGAEGCNRLSSDETEGDGEAPEGPEGPDCHPRPLACCAFGARLVGPGGYAFDRRWDRLRAVLQRMVEKHISSQMWKFASPPDGTPVLGYPAPFSHATGGGRGIFGILDTSPTPPGLDPPLSSLGRQAKVKPGRCRQPHGSAPGALGEAVGGRKRRAPPTSVSTSTTVSALPHCIPLPTLASNGTPPLSAKPEFSGRVEGDCKGAHVPGFHTPLEGDTCSPRGHSAESRKRKGCVTYTRPSKVPKLPQVASIFRKSGAGLLPAVPEPQLPAFPRQRPQHCLRSCEGGMRLVTGLSQPWDSAAPCRNSFSPPQLSLLDDLLPRDPACWVTVDLLSQHWRQNPSPMAPLMPVCRCSCGFELGSSVTVTRFSSC